MEAAPDRKKVPIPTNSPLATTYDLEYLAIHLTTLYLQQKTLLLPIPLFYVWTNYFLQVFFHLVIIHYLHMLWSFHREFIFSLQRSFLVRRYFPQSTGSVPFRSHSMILFFPAFFCFILFCLFMIDVKSNFKLEPSQASLFLMTQDVASEEKSKRHTLCTHCWSKFIPQKILWGKIISGEQRYSKVSHRSTDVIMKENNPWNIFYTATFAFIFQGDF